jgi:hypothetical protein
VPCAPFAVLESAADTQQADLARLLPGILKTSTMGYDGKGQVSVARLQDLPEAWASLGGVACVLEQRLALHRELSVIVARGVDDALLPLIDQHIRRSAKDILTARGAAHPRALAGLITRRGRSARCRGCRSRSTRRRRGGRAGCHGPAAVRPFSSSRSSNSPDSVVRGKEARSVLGGRLLR